MDIDEKDAALNALATLRDPKSSRNGIQDFRNAFLAASRPSFSSAWPLADARHNAVLALRVIISAWPTPDEEQIKTAIASVVSWINALRAHQ
jgi:hypothetical protein